MSSGQSANGFMFWCMQDSNLSRICRYDLIYVSCTMIEFSLVKLIETLMLMISCARDIFITSLLYVCEVPTCVSLYRCEKGCYTYIIILYNVWHNFIYGLVKHDTIINYGGIKNNIVWHIKICLHVCVCLRRENYLGFLHSI